MNLSRQTVHDWREKAMAGFARWLARAFPGTKQKQQWVPGDASVTVSTAVLTDHPAPCPVKPVEVADSGIAMGTNADIQPEVSGATEQKNQPEPLASKQNTPASFTTPLEWYKNQPRDMSLVIYIDQATAQIMEMLAISRRQAGNLFCVPMYAGKNTRWKTSGQHRMRRLDFDPAQIFQEQEEALGELEGLLSARWYSSSELAKLDQSILHAFDAACTSDGASVATLPDAPSAMDQLHALLLSRSSLGEEAKRIDESLIAAFQRIGVALPEPSLPAG